MTTSIIMCSIDDQKFQAAARSYERHFLPGACEIVRIPNARSLAEGYARGIAQSRGDQIILSHDDVEMLNTDLAGRIAAHLAEYDLIGVAGTTRFVGPVWTSAGPPYIFGQVAHTLPEGGIDVNIYGAPRRVVGNIQVMDGLFLAMHRRVAETIPFDAVQFDGFHGYDLDFTFAAHLAGLRLGVCTDLFPLHHSMGRFDDSWRDYSTRFLQKYTGRLAALSPRQWAWSVVRVPDRRAAIEVMNASAWLW